MAEAVTPEERVAKRIREILDEEKCVLVIRESGRSFTATDAEVRVVYTCDPTREGAILHSE